MTASAIDELRAGFEEPFWELGGAAARDRETVLLSWPSVPIELVRAAVRMPQWRLDKASYTVTGAPVVLDDLAVDLAGSVLRLLVVALLVMAVVLALVFRSRLRIVPLEVLCETLVQPGRDSSRRQIRDHRVRQFVDEHAFE